MSTTYVYAIYSPGISEAMDKAAMTIMEPFGGRFVGAGTFLPTSERDMQWEVESDKAADAVVALKKAGFVNSYQREGATP